MPAAGVMAEGASGLVASLAVWSLFLFGALQLYAALALLPGREHRAARGLLAALFAVNGALALLDVAVRLGATPRLFLYDALDDATNALLVLAAEACAIAVVGRAPRRGWLAGVVCYGFAVAAAPLALKVGGSSSPATFTLLAYAFAAARLVHAASVAQPGGPGTRWAPWLLLAFVPRALEFGVGYAYALEGSFAWLNLLHLPVLALLAISGLATFALAVRRPWGVAGAALFALLAAGVFWGWARLLRDASFSLVNEPVVAYFTLGGVRPVAVLGGIAAAGLLGATLQQATMLRHAVVVGGAAVAFAAATVAVPALLLAPASPLALLLAAALALVSVPLWAELAERTTVSMTVRGSRTPNAALQRDTVLAPTTDSTPLRPGLDPACRFNEGHLARYDEAARRVASMGESMRGRLASLTRSDRILLALNGSSPSTLGQWEYTQAGLQFATHVPYKHLASAVQGLNREGVRLVGTSTGVRGVRHYWLTPAGQLRAAEVAESVGFQDGEERAPLGEAFYRDGGVPRSPTMAHGAGHD